MAMKGPKLRTAAMASLGRKGAGDRVRGAVAHFLSEAEPGLQVLSDVGQEMRTPMVDALVAGGIMLELVKQLHAGKRADAEGLRIVGRFLKDYPTMLPHLQAQARRMPDPNTRELMNTLLARAQSEFNTQPKGR